MYNEVAREEIRKYLAKTGLNPGSMTAEQARSLMKSLQKNEFIKGFNAVVKEGPEAVKSFVEKKGYKLLPTHLQARALRGAATAKAVQKLGGSLVKKVPLIGYGFTVLMAERMREQGYSAHEIQKAVVDDFFYNVPGMAEAGVDAAWNHARGVAEGIMSGTFSYITHDYENGEVNGANGLIVSGENVDATLRRQKPGGHTTQARDLLW